ncbi:hypothetical protein M0802_013651 [Mischocyttarus mexicanus]|nr:hypothetical protein M0802_013658 [Mischocyttarus mexicanus]KAI4482498.1 hypothetical protein M0802_013651 [Mischocyttarus mexicanus]
MVRSILAISDSMELSKLALQADRIIEVSKPNMNSIQKPSTVPSSTSSPDRFQLEELKQEIRSMKSEMERRRLDRRRSSSSSRRGRSKERPSGLCFYHGRFGANARNCREPCAWLSTEEDDGDEDRKPSRKSTRSTCRCTCHNQGN